MQRSVTAAVRVRDQSASSTCGGVDIFGDFVTTVAPSSGYYSSKSLRAVSHNGGYRQCAGVIGHGPIPVHGLHAVWPNDNVFERVADHLRLHSQWFEIQVNAWKTLYRSLFTFEYDAVLSETWARNRYGYFNIMY